MHPADALDRIVYLLDRDLAEGQKVRAFAGPATWSRRPTTASSPASTRRAR